MSKVPTRSTHPVIRDREFARRLEIACEGNPHCPTDQYRGKQKWIYDNLQAQFGIKVSPEAVRRWFAGEMRPRPKTIAALARLLEVDLGWLTLGTKPDLMPRERRARNAVADGAVNLVAGIIQMNGGNVAFPEGAEDGADLFAIINGRQYTIEVKLAFDLDESTMRFTVSKDAGRHTVVGVIKRGEGIGVQLVLLTPEVLEQVTPRGDFREVRMERLGRSFSVGSQRVPEIVDIRDLRSDQVHRPPQGSRERACCLTGA